MRNVKQILKEVEDLRQKMMQVARAKGFQNMESIALSQQLDQLLNEYEKRKRMDDKCNIKKSI